MQGMETAYVGNGISAENASTTVGTEVIKAVVQKYQTNNQIGKATIEIDGFGTIDNVERDATITVYTTDFLVEGTIYKAGGLLTWGAIETNQPSIKINNPPESVAVGSTAPLSAEIKRTTETPTITWTTGDENIATVDNSGVVTGVSEGTATITAEIIIDGTKYSNTCSLTIKSDLVTIGTAINADKYGYKVNGYNVKISEVGCWRLFYQDTENTYIIANIPQGNYKPSDYYNASGETRYTTGKTVSGIAKGLNSVYHLAYPEKFILGSANMRTVAWMTDTTNSLWTQYKDSTGKAEWAIASPTIELLVASYNAVKENIDDRIENGETELTARTALTLPEANSDGNGYTNSWANINSKLPVSYNHGLYNYSTSTNWWLASPSSGRMDYGLYVDGNYSGVLTERVNNSNSAIRPLVCIPTTVFNKAVTAGTYTLTDE